MKKLLLFVMLFVAGVTQLKAEDTIVDVAQCYNGLHFYICINKYERMVLTIPPGCTDYSLTVSGEYHYENPVILDGNEHDFYWVSFYGCGISSWIEFYVNFIEPEVPNSITWELWKHQGYPITLESIGADSLDMYDFHWNTGETAPTIEVSEPGIYTCGISDQCATAIRTFIVQDNSEITLATCDLETNHNMVIWPTTPAQAEYISQVEIRRDGMVVGTVPYADGTFIDNIGSDAASRTYTITAIGTDGTPCPITSYPKETIHMAYLTGVNNTIEVNWNTPTGYDLMGYNICEWHEDDGSLNVIDYVGASVTSYTCSQSQFDQGYIVVQGVEAGKDGETRLLSNRSMDLVGLGENETTALTVYPNPVNGILFVETRRATSLQGETYLIMNPLGQTVMEGQITTEKQQIDVRNLPQGVYFITVGDATRKVVVE